MNNIIALTEEQRTLVKNNEHITVKQAFYEVTSQSTKYNIAAETTNKVILNGKVVKNDVKHSAISALSLAKKIAQKAEHYNVDVFCPVYSAPTYPRNWILDAVREILSDELGIEL